MNAVRSGVLGWKHVPARDGRLPSWTVWLMRGGRDGAAHAGDDVWEAVLVACWRQVLVPKVLQPWHRPATVRRRRKRTAQAKQIA
eukprot:COSAG03_NODE_2969_length_2319_cov_3.183333_1_plen_85_part_00